jgi:hypothetical protein
MAAGLANKPERGHRTLMEIEMTKCIGELYNDQAFYMGSAYYYATDEVERDKRCCLLIGMKIKGKWQDLKRPARNWIRLDVQVTPIEKLEVIEMADGKNTVRIEAILKVTLIGPSGNVIDSATFSPKEAHKMDEWVVNHRETEN